MECLQNNLPFFYSYNAYCVTLKCDITHLISWICCLKLCNKKVVQIVFEMSYMYYIK